MKRSWRSVIPVLSLFVTLSQNSLGQTLYGVTGGIKTPNAYIVDTGKCIFSAAYAKDYLSSADTLYNLWAININIGIHKRFELGFRFGIYPGLKGEANNIYDFNTDRILSLKFIIYRERNYIPQFAVGIQDIVGTRYFNSTYLAASKTIHSGKHFSALLNAGVGTKITDPLFKKDALNHRFIGFFGSAEISYDKRLYLTGEYDAKDINTGLRVLITKWLTVHGSLLNMKYFFGGIAVKITL